MVGFAYVWRRGDLDWVRSVGAEEATGPPQREPPSLTIEPETGTFGVNGCAPLPRRG